MALANSEIILNIEQYLRKTLKNVYPGNFGKLAEETVDEKRIEEQIRELSTAIGKSIKGTKLLEIGSGAGGLGYTVTN